MTTEGIKEKKAQIKTIVKNYEAQLEIPADTEAEEAEKEADKNGLQTMEIDEAEGRPSLKSGMSPLCPPLAGSCVGSSLFICIFL